MRSARIHWLAASVVAMVLTFAASGPAGARSLDVSTYVPASTQRANATIAPCSEVCSGGGYRSLNRASSPRLSVGAAPTSTSSPAAPRPYSAPSRVPRRHTAGTKFDWEYVAAGGALAVVVLLAVGGILAVSRQRRRADTRRPSKIAA
jgi:hypothetical protein